MSNSIKNGSCGHPLAETVEFIPASALVPDRCKEWFWEALDETDHGFTWGCNNRSLVMASDFLSAAEKAFEQDDWRAGTDELLTERAVAEFRACRDGFLSELKELGETLIDLEN